LWDIYCYVNIHLLFPVLEIESLFFSGSHNLKTSMPFLLEIRDMVDAFLVHFRLIVDNKCYNSVHGEVCVSFQSEVRVDNRAIPAASSVIAEALVVSVMIVLRWTLCLRTRKSCKD